MRTDGYDPNRLTHLHLDFGRSYYFLLGPVQNEHNKGLEEMHQEGKYDSSLEK